MTEELIRSIEAAFRDTAYPGDDRLTDGTYGEEPAALIEAFRDKHDWRELRPEFLNRAPTGCGSALAFFSAAALQFFLPAYLICDVKGMLTGPDPSVRLCTFLTPQDAHQRLAKAFGGGTLGEAVRKQFQIFTPEQVRAIVAYLQWKLRTDGYNPTIEQALENYWLGRGAS